MRPTPSQIRQTRGRTSGKCFLGRGGWSSGATSAKHTASRLSKPARHRHILQRPLVWGLNQGRDRDEPAYRRFPLLPGDREHARTRLAHDDCRPGRRTREATRAPRRAQSGSSQLMRDSRGWHRGLRGALKTPAASRRRHDSKRPKVRDGRSATPMLGIPGSGLLRSDPTGGSTTRSRRPRKCWPSGARPLVRLHDRRRNEMQIYGAGGRLVTLALTGPKSGCEVGSGWVQKLSKAARPAAPRTCEARAAAKSCGGSYPTVPHARRRIPHLNGTCVSREREWVAAQIGHGLRDPCEVGDS